MATGDEFDDPMLTRDTGLSWYVRHPLKIVFYKDNSAVQFTEYLFVYGFFLAYNLLILSALLVFGLLFDVDMSAAVSAMNPANVAPRHVMRFVAITALGFPNVLMFAGAWKAFRGLQQRDD